MRGQEMLLEARNGAGMQERSADELRQDKL